MHKQLTIYIYAGLIILAGIIMIILNRESIEVLQNAMAICLIPAGLFALITTEKSRNLRVQFSYHLMHALEFIIYSIALLFYTHDQETFYFSTLFLFMFHSISEITFCNWLFDLKSKVNLPILLKWVFLGLAIGSASIFIYSYSELGQDGKLIGNGIIFIVIGLNILIYKPVIKIQAGTERM